MSAWDPFPSTYRAAEVRMITAAVRAGECVSIVGLSGAGKSNLLGFLARPQSTPEVEFVLVDGNRMTGQSTPAFFDLIRQALDDSEQVPTADAFRVLDSTIERRLSASPGSLSLLMDLSPLFSRLEGLVSNPEFTDNLRALRDVYKFRLTYVFATRHSLPARTELSELFYGRELWLGPLSEEDARWNVARFADRKGLAWDVSSVAPQLIAVSRGYPSLLRAVCEAHAAGSSLEESSLARHPAVAGRVKEFWADNPTNEEVRLSGLERLPLLQTGRASGFDTSRLTAKELLLLEYFQAHPGVVCEKDDLIRSVWPEDRILERGVRDDSLAQLIRRLREKIELDAANPRYIRTVPGRGYRFDPEPKESEYAKSA